MRRPEDAQRRRDGDERRTRRRTRPAEFDADRGRGEKHHHRAVSACCAGPRGVFGDERPWARRTRRRRRRRWQTPAHRRRRRRPARCGGCSRASVLALPERRSTYSRSTCRRARPPPDSSRPTRVAPACHSRSGRTGDHPREARTDARRTIARAFRQASEAIRASSPCPPTAARCALAHCGAWPRSRGRASAHWVPSRRRALRPCAHSHTSDAGDTPARRPPRSALGALHERPVQRRHDEGCGHRDRPACTLV